ncbi:MAG TPA: hypothetical protein VMS77_05470 [Conexivisphaerales archaeon]|nr:hypothetical protein [Conexivisphaerales archaeon]
MDRYTKWAIVLIVAAFGIRLVLATHGIHLTPFDEIGGIVD